MPNTQEILEKYNLNWNVVKKPLMYAGECTPEANNGLHHTPFYAIVREDTGEVFTTVSGSYTPTQNSKIIETMQEIAGENDLEIIKAVPLHNGRKIIVQMKKSNNRIHIGNEETQQYVYAINGHDGSSSLKFGFMNKVIFCQNQFAWLSRNALSGYRHTISIQDKVKELPSILNFTDQEERIADLQEFNAQKTNVNLINDLVDHLTKTGKIGDKILHTRTKNIRDDLENSIVHEMNRIGSNKWALFNGVTRFTTHDKKTPNREYGEIESIYTGSCMQMNEKAFKFLKEN